MLSPFGTPGLPVAGAPPRPTFGNRRIGCTGCPPAVSARLLLFVEDVAAAELHLSDADLDGLAASSRGRSHA